MKAPLFDALASAFCLVSINARASEWSLRERGFIKAIPPLYANHTAGFVVDPSAEDVQAAIEFGRTCKEKAEPLQYAYIFKSTSGFFANDAIYVSIETPLALIAKHAQEQAQEYRSVDRNYVAFLSKLTAVRLSLSQQYISARTWTAFASMRQIILLRDGERVESLTEVPAWHGGNPFPKESRFDKRTQAAVAETQKNILASVRPSFAAMDDGLKRATLQTYRITGLSDKAVQSGLGLTADEYRRLMDDGGAESASYALGETDAVFSAKELNKPGKYEIVFRQPKVGLLGEVTEKEVRIPSAFSSYR